MNARASLATTVALLVALSSTAFAQDRRDVRLAEDIGRSITTYTRLTIFDDINATVENGMVVLSGKVTMPYKKTDMEKRIAKVDGVRGVRSDISVLPVSQFDDELRHRAVAGQRIALVGAELLGLGDHRIVRQERAHGGAERVRKRHGRTLARPSARTARERARAGRRPASRSRG